MNIARQLYQLQGTDLELASRRKTLAQWRGQLGENQAVIKAQARLDSGKTRLNELKKQQQSVEWEVDDLSSKISTAEDKLYGGGIVNPKELSSLQHEVEGWKGKRGQLEDTALELMESVEAASTDVAFLDNELKQLQTEWQARQGELSRDIEQVEGEISGLEGKRERALAGIDAEAIAVYDKLRKRKPQVVARVEQGICSGCRVSLPTTDLQQARRGGVVRCGSCGDILFIA